MSRPSVTLILKMMPSALFVKPLAASKSVLVLENAPMAEIETVLGFCRSIGLPTNLHMMGVKELDMARLMEVAKASTAEGETIHNMPFKVTAEDVLAAIVTAHQLGL